MAAAGFDHVITRKVAVGSGSVGGSTTKNAGARVSLDVDVANAVTDGQHVLTIDVSQVKSFFILSDKAVTIETNSGGSPANTLTLTAGVAYEWYEGSAASFALTTDVTALYITNASGATARIQSVVTISGFNYFVEGFVSRFKHRNNSEFVHAVLSD